MRQGFNPSMLGQGFNPSGKPSGQAPAPNRSTLWRGNLTRPQNLTRIIIPVQKKIQFICLIRLIR